ncbi:MAG: hsp70 nucleotide exchange factor fes1 [Bathelium mastoideum]|nr:MAG: hsp70 nucleotide exchange factor fes1 [Bathelium mastoideum]KAI9689491.1 MAG: hsp70 nucleotide exchange factor fes1 [Bathelium mastoideum]
MTDPGLNRLLKWSVENSSANPSDPSTQPNHDPARGLDSATLAQILGGPSEADLMKAAMASLTSPTTSAADKATAIENLHLLLESLDNANLLAPLGLWPPLVSLLSDADPGLRRGAASCIGTAVQNHRPTQDQLRTAEGALPQLVAMALGDPDVAVRRAAVRAVSSAVRNCPPSLEDVLGLLPQDIRGEGSVDAGDMEAVDEIIGRLRERANKTD